MWSARDGAHRCPRDRALGRGSWAYVAILIAVVLVIRPIVWASLIFGAPIWILGTTFFLLRPEPRSRALSAAAVA